MKVDSDSQDAVVTVELVGGTKGPVTLDEDRNIVLLIKNKDTQSIKVTNGVILQYQQPESKPNVQI